AQIAPPGIPCPPTGYGASELVCSNLTEQLVRQGHEVTLFAHEESRTKARLVSFPSVSRLTDATERELAHASLAVERADDFDILHNHCITPGPAVIRLASCPTLTSLHYLRPLIAAFSEEPYVAVSHAQARSLSHLNVIGVAHNGVNLENLPLGGHKRDYLLFIGRIDPKKAPHLAIQAARRLDLPLLLAASYPSEDNIAYWEEQVKPGLGGKIRYVGEVSAADKGGLIGGARAVLMPQQWEEPFGLVAAEAMACGTPVVAMRRGALPEIVPHGVGGFIVDDLDGMVEAVRKIDQIDASDCRRVVEENFSAEVMTAAYLDLYETLVRQPVPLPLASTEARAS
ncbi:MAG: glycosyltransferase family 4 protein, partial [Chloroflexota bacterium]